MIRAIRRLRRFVNPTVAAFAFMIAVSIFIGLGARAYDRYRRLYQITIAAGGSGGESFLIAQALQAYIQRQFKNVSVSVVETKGTAANLALLETGQADFATAQADVALERWIRPSGEERAKQGRLVSVLYLDQVQLLTCSSSGAATNATRVFEAFMRRQGAARVYLPYEASGQPSGGQVETFLRIAAYFGLTDAKHYRLVNDHGSSPRVCDEREQGNVIFRVRAPGNRGIQDAIEKGWRLAALTNIGALRRSNQAVASGSIPEGTYRIRRDPQLSEPEPQKPLETLEVARVLLAKRSDSIPSWLTHQVARALNEEGPVLARIEGNPKSSKILRQLFLRIPYLNRNVRLRSLGVPLHDAAATYYEPQLAWSARLNDWADTYSLGLTIFAMFVSFLIALNRGFEWMGKSHLDELIAEVTRLMAIEANPASDRKPSPGEDIANFPVSEIEFNLLTEMAERGNHIVYWLMVGLLDGRHRERVMTELYEQASRDFRREEFSPESFRTFSEAYKSARESVETANEKRRRELVEFYVGALLGSLAPEHNPYQNASRREILREAQRVVGVSPMFSRGGFRTLAEAYGLAIGDGG